MTALKKHEAIGNTFGNHVEYKRVRYDFTKDAGAVGALDIFTASDKVKVVDFHSTVKTACTSGGSATVAVGPTGALTKFLTATQGAVANLVANACLTPLPVEGTPNVLAFPHIMAAGDKIIQTIGTAALTAGSIEYTVGFIRC